MAAKPKLVSIKANEPQFKIERGVPLPLPKGALLKYPWAEMQVGDSFFVPAAAHANVSAMAQQWGKRNGCKFTTRKADGGIRVWRIE